VRPAAVTAVAHRWASRSPPSLWNPSVAKYETMQWE
jgi:hypothetical protein